uniref:Putative secreted protein n=1 Tax=Anopheles triannulatus TaxID=58253 RepID=A0A2M4B254_9DIPT
MLFLLFGKAAYYFMFQLNIQFDVAAIPLEVVKPVVRLCVGNRNPIVCMYVCVYIARWCMCVSMWSLCLFRRLDAMFNVPSPQSTARHVCARTNNIFIVGSLFTSLRAILSR